MSAINACWFAVSAKQKPHRVRSLSHLGWALSAQRFLFLLKMYQGQDVLSVLRCQHCFNLACWWASNDSSLPLYICANMWNARGDSHTWTSLNRQNPGAFKIFHANIPSPLTRRPGSPPNWMGTNFIFFITSSLELGPESLWEFLSTKIVVFSMTKGGQEEIAKVANRHKGPSRSAETWRLWWTTLLFPNPVQIAWNSFLNLLLVFETFKPAYARTHLVLTSHPETGPYNRITCSASESRLRPCITTMVVSSVRFRLAQQPFLGRWPWLATDFTKTRTT